MSVQANEIRHLARRLLQLVLAPTTISLAAIGLTNLATRQPIPSWIPYSAIAGLVLSLLCYFVAYTRLFEDALLSTARSLRARQYGNPRVLVLDGRLSHHAKETAPNPEHTDRPPADWVTALRAQGWRVEAGPTSRITDPHPPAIVLNPFGEVYPEQDFVSSTTISRIREYVTGGGVYVNVAGIPFWYRYDPTSARSETAGRVEGIFEDHAVWKSLFYDLFPNLTPSPQDPQILECHQTPEDIARFGDIASAGGDISIRHFRAYPLSPAQLLPILRTQNHCVIGALNSGEGAYLFAGVSIPLADSTFHKVVAAVKAWASYEARSRRP